MGTDAHLVVTGGDAGLVDVARARIESLDARWSRFLPSSELCRMNEVAGSPTVVPPDTFDVVALAIEAWRLTAGRFDPTVLHALVAAGYDRSFEQLAPAATRSAPGTGADPAPGCGGIVLDELLRTVRLPAGVALDLGGIGKGRAADLVVGELLAAGAEGACVNLGGDVRVAGRPPADAEAWHVGVTDPFDPDVDLCVLAVTGGAVTTSTRLRRRWSGPAGDAHHLLDPATGAPVDSGLAAVTVVAAEAAWAEVLAKAAFVAGAAEGVELLTASGAEGLLVRDDGAVHETAGFERFLG